MTKTILITRESSQSAELIAILKNSGFAVINEPIFTVKKLNVKINPKVDFVIITSANACECLASSSVSKETKIFAIGKQSAKRLGEFGFKNVVFPEEYNAKSLLNLILQEQKRNGIYFHGEEITLDFKNELEKEGFKVEKILAYKINWHQDFSKEFLEKIKTTKIDFVLFYSKNNAKNFYKLAKNNNLLEYFMSSKLLSISEEVADILRKFGFKNCSNFNEIAALEKFYK